MIMPIFLPRPRIGRAIFLAKSRAACLNPSRRAAPLTTVISWPERSIKMASTGAAIPSPRRRPSLWPRVGLGVGVRARRGVGLRAATAPIERYLIAAQAGGSVASRGRLRWAVVACGVTTGLPAGRVRRGHDVRRLRRKICAPLDGAGLSTGRVERLVVFLVARARKKRAGVGPMAPSPFANEAHGPRRRGGAPSRPADARPRGLRQRCCSAPTSLRVQARGMFE